MFKKSRKYSQLYKLKMKIALKDGAFDFLYFINKILKKKKKMYVLDQVASRIFIVSWECATSFFVFFLNVQNSANW